MKASSIIVVFIFLLFGCKTDFTFHQKIVLNDYPSGSGSAYFKEHIYLIGDDATDLLIINSNLEKVDSIKLFSNTEKRISKENKPDLEAATIIYNKNKIELLLLGSGSLSPYRNIGVLIDVNTKEKQQIDLNPFYSRLKKEGLDALNIEGVTAAPGGFIIASRGNKSFPANYLIFTANNFFLNQDSVPVRKTKVGINADTAAFAGISGLEYSKRSDRLLLTVSTENTYNTFDDGTIGKSYLWIIENISAKRNMMAINPTRIIDLDELDARFKGHKIESVCILSENYNNMELALVADDDKGATILFRITLKK